MPFQVEIERIKKWDFLDVQPIKNGCNLFREGKLVATAIDEDAKVIKGRKPKAFVLDVKDGIATIELLYYVEIHRHSGYSLLDGAIPIKKLVEKTESVGALTDHGVMFGILDYYKKMLAANKKPILGCELYVETRDGKKEGNHLIVLAKNLVGYKNLIKLSTLGYSNFYRKPHVSYDMLKKYGEGLIGTTACIGGEVPQLILSGNYKKAKETLLELASFFAPGDFYIEIQRHGISEEAILNPQLIKLSKETGIKLVAATDSHYVNAEDSYEHEILLCIGTQSKITDEKRMRFNGTGYHLHSSSEVCELFKDIPEAVENSLEIAEKCNVELDLKTIYMPSFQVPPPFKDDYEYFEYLTRKGFAERFGSEFNNPIYKERLEFEIGIIKKMGFPSYFLIVADFINYAKSKGIEVGPGRGSACGSLVAYCLRITEIDPIPYGLLFERFLNVDRISMPDIDLDFDDERREEVIDYVKQKYGKECVSRIITFGTLSARAAIRDVTRVLDYPYAFGDKISKVITDPKLTLKQQLEQNIELKKMYDEDPDVKKIIDISMKIEGLPRNASMHACGVIIAKTAVVDYVPQIMMETEIEGVYEPTTQFNMFECEECGLLKMDFLGLRTMGVINRALVDINKKRAKEGKTPLTYGDIPINDPAVYDFISKGNTHGVFQLESPGMTAFMRELFQDACNYTKLKTEEELKKFGEELFERVIAGVSLYRPGPMDEIPNYINNMLHPEQIVYEIPALKRILDATYGIIVYQEQVMFIVRELAGFSKGQSDTIRKAMGKKKKEIIDEYEEYFIYGSAKHDEKNPSKSLNIPGCINCGIPEDVARTIWGKMKKFAEYAFNKSHATAYADIGVRTAWLAFYYPVEYMCATLNSFITKAEKIRLYMAICKKKGIKILPPDVNKSEEKFTVEGDSIRFGLMGIKNMGKAAKDIVYERKKNGPFADMQDFAERMALYSRIDKKMLEALIYASALDEFEGTRKAKLAALPNILSAAASNKKQVEFGQLSLFDSPEMAVYKKVPIPEMEEFEKRYKLEKEKEYSGFYVTEHPLDEYAKITSREDVVEINDVLSDDSSETSDEDILNIRGSLYENQNVKLCGIMRDVVQRYTRSGNRLITFILEDKSGEIKCTAFNSCIEENEGKFTEGNICYVLIKVKTDDFGTQGILQKIHVLSAAH